MKNYAVPQVKVKVAEVLENNINFIILLNRVTRKFIKLYTFFSLAFILTIITHLFSLLYILKNIHSFMDFFVTLF